MGIIFASIGNLFYFMEVRMPRKILFAFVFSLVYATPNYFICSVAQSSATSCSALTSKAFSQLKTYSSSKYLPPSLSSKPLFFNIQTQLQHKSPHLLSYADVDSYSNTYAKNLKHLKILSSLTLNTVSKNYYFSNAFARFTMGAGMYANLQHIAGRGGFAYYRNSTLSLEGRFHLATSLILKQQHLLELSLQLPLFITGIFGYEATRADNVLIALRFVYGGKEYNRIEPNVNEKLEITPPPPPISL